MELTIINKIGGFLGVSGVGALLAEQGGRFAAPGFSAALAARALREQCMADGACGWYALGAS